MTNRQLYKCVPVRPRPTQMAHYSFNFSFSAFILEGYGVLFFLLLFLGISATPLNGQCPTSLDETNNGLHFNGTTDYVTINSCCNGNIFPGGDAITIEYWFKGSNTQSAVRMQTGKDNYIVAGWQNNKHILSNDGGTAGGVSIGTGANDGNWHHVAMTWQKGSKFTSYLDGIQIEQKTASSTALPSFNTGVYLGAFGGISEFTNGTLDEVRVWTVARTQVQIQEGQYTCSPSDQSGLLVFYRFNQGTANSANAGNTGLLNSASYDLPGVLTNFDLTTTTNWVSGFPLSVGISIVTSPILSSSQCIGNSPTLTAKATTYGLTTTNGLKIILWQYKAAGASNYIDINASVYTSNTDATYTIPPLRITDDGTLYRAVFKGCCGDVVTDVVTVNLSTRSIRLYVKADATGGKTGLDWTNAFTDLQSALNYPCASVVTEIWVAKGTYKPSSVGNRSASFVMLPNVDIYGSFVGTEANLAERTAAVRAANVSILSGDLLGNDVITGSGSTLSITNNVDNSFHVVVYKPFINNNNVLTNANALLDGFTITGGNAANDNPLFSVGGGMLNSSSPSLSNVTFLGNNASNGGGMYSGGSATSLSNVTFLSNNASNGGGGLFNSTSSLSLSDVTFSGNNASNGGGGMLNYTSAPSLSNVTFSGNNASNGGGGMLNYTSAPSLSNVTFSSNNASNGGGMYNYISSFPIIKNSIFWGNKTGSTTVSSIEGDAANVTYSDVEQTSGIYAGTGNINQDPLFVNAANPAGADGIFGTADDGLALTHCSPALNAGNNAGVTTTDIVGNPRIFGGTVDMGAYEFQAASQYYITSPTTTNNALNFDGTNDYVEINNCSNNALTNTDALTIEYWFKGTSNHSAVRLQPDNNSYIIAGYISGGTGLHLVRINNVPYSVATGNATDGNWHHVAMTWQRNTTNGFKSYLDGVLVAQTNTPNAALPVITSGMFLGSRSGLSEFTNGSIDEMRLWNVVRTQAQIQAAMSNFNLSVPQTGLKLYYQFNHGQANSANAGLVTLTNSADPNNYIGALHNFSLNGVTSNWVSTYSVPPTVSLSIKAILQGPYNSTTGLMNDALRSLVSFPLTSPYNTGESIASSVLTVTGNNAVVDWVKVELRDKITASTVVKTVSGLLLRNGNIVDLDGSSPLKLNNIAADNYYVVVKHRNHLGVATSSAVALSSTVTSIDFTTDATYGTAAQKSVSGTFPTVCMWAGDVNGDGKIKYTNASNDRAFILSRLNGILTGLVTGYYNEDLNLDGFVKYTNASNDRAFILSALNGVLTGLVTAQLP